MGGQATFDDPECTCLKHSRTPESTPVTAGYIFRSIPAQYGARTLPR